MKHIAVLMGGISAERDVSLKSGAAVSSALRELGYKISEVDVGFDIADVLTRLAPDIAFNALHGRYGEDGCIQGLLEVLEIPYTHSGVLASALAMDKEMAKKVFKSSGINTPGGFVVTKDNFKNGDPLPRPYVLKPVNEGSSVGVYIIKKGDNLDLENIFSDYPKMLAEPFIAGRELAVAVLDERALGVVELRSSKEFYDYEAKYTDGVTTHLMPAPIHNDAYKKACEMALAAHKALGCRGLSRSDFRYDDTNGEPGELYILEVNTQPGMTRLSLSPEIAAYAGINFNSLVENLVSQASLSGVQVDFNGKADNKTNTKTKAVV